MEGRPTSGAASTQLVQRRAARTTLVGRGHELAAVVQLLDAGARLVTVTGTGGAGKTRLAVEVAARVAPSMPDGTPFVELAGVRDPAVVPLAVAAELGASADADATPLEQLGATLRHRRALLVLDSFEHVLPAADVVLEVLDACPDVTVLVTSRTPLRVHGEHVLRLTPLALPPAGLDDPDALLDSPAVELFCRRAAAVRADFRLDAGNAASVAAICRRLDGLPLAVELAAAQVGALAPPALLQRLEGPVGRTTLRSLRRAPVDVPERHRSLWRTVDASYLLLDERARRLFRRLAVFEDGFTLDAVDAVCAPGADGDSFDLVADLVDLNLVDPDERAPSVARFTLLHTIRDFARDRALAEDDVEALSARATEHFTSLAATASAALDGPAELGWLDVLEREQHNLRATLDRLHQGGARAEALRLAVHLAPFWLRRGHVVEGLTWLDRFLDVPADGDAPELALARMWRARLSVDGTTDPGALERAVADIEAGVVAARAVGDATTLLRALSSHAHALSLTSDPARALPVDDEGVALARAAGADWWLPDFLQRSGFVAHLHGDVDRAVTLTSEALRTARRGGNDRMVVHAGMALVHLSETVGRGGVEVPELLELLELARRIRYQRSVVWLGVSVGVTTAMSGDTRQGAERFREALRLADEIGYWQGAGFALMGLMGTALLQDEPAMAAGLHGGLAEHIPSLQRAMPAGYFAIYRSLADQLTAALPADVLAEALAAGARRSRSEVVRYGLEVADHLRAGARDAGGGSTPRAGRAGPGGELTAREVQVLRQLAAGDTNKDIARLLGISAKTVMHHTTSIYRKLGVRGRSEATAFALRERLVES